MHPFWDRKTGNYLTADTCGKRVTFEGNFNLYLFIAIVLLSEIYLLALQHSKQLFGARSDREVILKELFDDYSIAIDYVYTGIGNAIPRVIVLRNRGVEDAESSDNFTISVRKHRKSRSVRILKIRERINFVVTQNVKFCACGFKCRHSFFQLDQLGTARRSPHRRASEN